MINAQGELEFDSPRAIITPRSTRDEFLISPLFPISKPLNQNAPYSRYKFPVVGCAHEPFSGDICFCSGAIYSVSLVSGRPEFCQPGDDSRLQEQAVHCFHKELLRHLFGRLPDRQVPWGPDRRDADVGFLFHWGEVWASTDVKSHFCRILIKYAD